MLLSLFLTCVISLAFSTVLLLAVGHRLRIASRILGVVLAAANTVTAGEVAARLWQLPTGSVLAAEGSLLVTSVVVALTRPR